LDLVGFTLIQWDFLGFARLTGPALVSRTWVGAALIEFPQPKTIFSLFYLVSPCFTLFHLVLGWIRTGFAGFPISAFPRAVP
jgi:hypothetical protein